MMIIKRLILLACLSSLSSLSWGKDIKHPQFNFAISTHKIKATDLHYAFVSVNQQTFYREAGPFAALLGASKNIKNEDKHILIRAVFPITKAIGNFEPDSFNELSFVQRIDEQKKVRKLKDNTFLTQNSSPISYQYFSKFHFDADDLSSLPDSKIGHKITELKSSDPLLQSANATIYRQMFGFSSFLKESSEFYGFIALDETRTLVVYMKLAIYSPDSILDYAIERDLLKRVKTFKTVLEKH